MKEPVLLPPTHDSLLSAFRTYLTSLGLSSISRKLYSADIARLLSSSAFSNLTLSTLSNPKTYLTYLTQPELSGSTTLLRRNIASLKQFGLFLSHSFSIPNPTQNLSLSTNQANLGLSSTSDKYIKACIQYLKENHLSESSLRSYKSDITQYLTYLESHNPSTHINLLLNEKNLQIYADMLAHLATQSPATIERKLKTIRRFINWHTQSTPHPVMSDNIKIAANSHSYYPKAIAVPPTPSNPADNGSQTTATLNPSPDHNHNSVKKVNYRKFRLPTLRSFISMAILLVLVSTLSIFTYRQFGREASLTAAFPNTPVTPNRQLSFQGRLENASGTPITSATNFVFKLYDASSGGTELYSSGTCSITPDTDGVFSTQIGGTCGSGISSSVFTENADIWLEVTVGAEILTPRQQIATVAYALNSETIQGFPISATVSAIRNTVVPMNQWGEIIVGEQSPRLTGVSGTFQISAPSLSLVTATGTNGNITLAPDGTGQVNVNGNTTATNFFNVSNAQLTTGSLITGTAANNNTGFNLLNLLSGSSPTSKFSVSDAGNVTLAGDLTITGGNITSATTFDSTLTSTGTLTANGTFDANGQLDLGDGGDTITINGSSITLTGFNCAANTNGGTLTTNGSGVLQCSDDDGGGSGGGSNWQSSLGTLSPVNSTWDVLVGGTATSSAKIGFININSGTPTINLANQASNIAVIDNTASALRILEGSNNYLSLTTTNSSENLSFGNTTTNPTYSFLGTGLTTLSGGLTVNGISTLGNNSATVEINSSDWDITTVGNMSGIGTISSDGDWTNSQATPTIFLTDSTASSDDYSINVDANAFNITNATDSRVELEFVGDGSINLGDNTTTKTIDIGGVTSSAIDTINIGTNATAADIISIGNNHATTTLALTGGTAWSMTTAGNLTTNNTTVNGNTVLGNAITDTIDFQGRVLQDADLIPITTTGTNDLGSSSLAWDNLYTNAAYFAGGTSFYVDASGNARFNDIIAADTANPGITVGDGSTGFLKVGSLTVGDNNASVVTFDTNSDATPEFQLYNTGSATASGDITMGGQLQVGRFAATPTALGAGTMIFNTTTNSFQCYNGTAWTSCGGTLFSNSNTSVADGSYITVTHNLASNDLLSNAWINAQGVWKSLDAAYKPAIAWEGKDTQKGVYHNNVNSYQPVGNETGTYTNTLHEGMVFDTFEDTTKTDSANTTSSIFTSLGDDGSSNFATLDQRIQNGRVGLMGGQTLSTGETDNDGQNYLGSNTVNDMYYYDRAKDSTPEVLVELGIDPNWYNGVTLSVATGSAQYSQAGTLADKNPNLTTTYNGSLIKVTGTDSTPRTIFITIKSPTTFDWTNYQGDAATGVTITPGTAQTLGSTGVSVTFTGGVTYNTGDVFKIASWFIEGESSTRGARQSFPERSYISASGSAGSGYIDVIDADTQKLWMRFSQGTGYYVRSTGNRVPKNIKMLNGKLYFGQNDGAGTLDGILERINFDSDSLNLWTASNKYTYDQGVSLRNSASNLVTINSTETIVANYVNDIDAAVIPNHPTKEITVSGWGYIVGDSDSYISESVLMPYSFNGIPNVTTTYAGRITTGSVPKSLTDCSAHTPTFNISSAPLGINNSSFVISLISDSATALSSSYYLCYTWTATGTVSPKQFVAVATGATSGDGGNTIFNETDGTKADILVGSQHASAIWQTRIAMSGNSLYSSDSVDAATDAEYLIGYNGVHGLQSESSWAQYINEPYGVGNTSYASSIILGTSGSYNQIKSLHATPNTSTLDGVSNTVYIGTAQGVTVLHTKQDKSTTNDAHDGTNSGYPSSVKYFTKDYVSEEMVGDIRGMWPLNASNTSSDLEDVSIKANALTATNISSADVTSGIRKEATDFDGSTEYLSCTDASCGGTSDLDYPGSGGWSFGSWFRADGGAGTQRSIINKSVFVSAGNNGGYSMYLHSDNTVRTTIMNNSSTNLSSNTTPTIGEWYHAVVVFDGSTIKMYVNGQLENSIAHSVGIQDTTQDFYIGRASSSSTLFFDGAIDDTFVTATALTPAQIKNMYQVGYRALQSHGTTLSSGTADGNQSLAGASNNIGVVIPDYNNQFMYVGTNHTTDGALTKVQLNSDTAIKNWDTGDNDPDGGAQIVDDDITSLAVGETLYAVGSAASGIKSMGVDDNATATSGNFVSKTYTLPKNIGSAVLWASPILDGSDGSNTITVQASNDGGSNYVTCSLVNTNSNYSVPEKEYACTFTTADNDLKVRFQFARGSTKTNTYIVQYGISWLGETGFRVEQTDNNNVRLYNFSGETQNLRLNVTGGGTSVMANPWTDGGSYIYATGYETLRIYDGAGTNYLGLSHDGTYATLGYNGTDYLNLTSTGDLLPETNDTQALGSDTFRWEDVFLGPGSMHIGTSTTDEGVISYDTASNILNIGTDSTSNGDIAFFTDDLYLDKSTSSVGIGDTTPDYLLDVAGTAGFDSTLTLTGTAANIALGSNYLSGDGGDEGVFVDSTGNVGIGSNTPNNSLEVKTTASTSPIRLYNNNVDSTEYWTVGPVASDNYAIFNESSLGLYIAHGATTWTSNSDERLKTNIESLTSVEGLSSLLQLNPVNYNWKDVNANHDKQTGFIAQEVQKIFPSLVNLGDTRTITLEDGTTQTIESPLGINYTGFIPYIIKAIQEQQVEITQLVQNLITPNVQVATISPLAPEQDITITAPVTITPATPNLDTPTLLVDGEVDASTISARIARLETINTESLTARNIVADTITANTIVGLDAKIASLSAGISDSEFETISDRIKARLASLTGNDANAQDIPVPPSKPETIIEYNDLATASATLATADIDFATVNNYLAVIGSATITTLDITNGLYTNSIGSKDNLLAIQPLGGIVNIANNTFIVDSTGQVMVNGDLTVSGKILAGSANLGALEIGSPLDATVSSALGNLLAVYNEQGEAVATIDASGSANLATLTTQLVTIASGGSVATQSGLISSQTSSNSTAGASSLLSPDTERTIESPFVTPNSLVYLTPTTNTDNKVLFVKAKNTCDLNSLACTPSFTVGIDAPATTDIGFNWWIIELKQ